MPRFSVIIPAHNSARFLPHALSSVLCQTERDLEIIVVDDGSTDNTVELVEGYNDPRVRILRCTKAGVAAARNVGIASSDSEFVAFLDSDDIWSPNYLKTHSARLAEEANISMTFCFSSAINAVGEPMGITFAPSERRLRSLSPFSIMISNPIVCASAAVLRRSALQQISLQDDGGKRQYFRTCLRHAQDTDLWSRIAALPGWRMACLCESLVSYRVHSGSSSASLESLEVSLIRLRNIFFERHPETNTPAHRRLACGYHLRYLAQTAVLRSQSRYRPIAYIGRALMVSPAALQAEGKISLLTVASSLAQLGIGPHGTRWLIRVASPFCVG